MPTEIIDYHSLLHSLQTGKDSNALNALFNASRKRLFAMAFAVLKHEESAKDVVQDFYIDFWENELYNRISGSLQSYMARSIWNRAINYKLRQRTFSQLKIDLELEQEDVEVYRIENQELNLEITSAINKLSPMVKKVFVMHYIESLSYSEITEQLGISKSTISTHMDKALKKLRVELKKVYKK
jgi:RNA polymerase sigma factor (sigma-70 family)